MHDYDRSNFVKFLQDFPKQPGQSARWVDSAKISIKTNDIKNIVFAGMGGSAISGNIILDYLADQLPVPGQVLRDYDPPAYVNKDTLLIAVSYSGNTEETLSTLRAAIDRGARIVCICSGGEMAAMCSEHSLSRIEIQGGLPPRQALGFIFFTLLGLLQKLGLIEDQSADIDETVSVLQNLVHRFDPSVSLGHNLANHIAQSIYHAIPVVYSGTPWMQSIPVRWRNQFNENSKTMAFSNSFPELNHNEIMGWEGLADVNKHFRVIFLRDNGESARVKQRISITKSILRKNNVLFGEVFAEGNSRLARIFSLICAGDWASYYLAMLNEKDPIKIGSIDYLKEKLAAVAE